MAGWGRRFRIVIQGCHHRTGRPFIWHMFQARPGVGASSAGDGVRWGACGMAGGRDGLPHRYRLVSNGRVRVLRTKEVGVRVQPGDVFLVESGGGWGWGDPRLRASEARAADLENGFVTRRPPARRRR
jgi:N-methylhydantoinase B